MAQVAALYMACMAYKVLKHEVGVAALDPHPIADPYRFLLRAATCKRYRAEQPRKPDSHGIGRCRRVWCRV